METNLPSTIEVVITPRDVLTTEDFWCNDCALGKAVKRKVKTEHIGVGTYWVEIDKVRYNLDVPFMSKDFNDLHALALRGERFKIKKTLTRQV